MNNCFRYIASVLLLFIFASASAQVEMADTMRSEGKIYVVVAIVLVILTGLILYLFLLDKKLKRIEKELRDKRQTKS